MSSETMVRECSRCGAIVSKEDKFCKYCGANIESSDVYLCSEHIERKIDEARLKEIEYKHELDLAKAEIEKIKSKRQWIMSLLGWAGPLLFIFGIFFVWKIILAIW